MGIVYGEADQVTPPFAVVNTRPSSSVTVARLGLDALTAVMLASAGALAPNQPFFVRRNTRPLSPTTQATSAFTKTLARIGRSAVCSVVHVAPPSLDDSTF